MQLYGDVGPFELSELALSDFKAAEEAHKEANDKFDTEMFTYKSDMELYEKEREEYER